MQSTKNPVPSLPLPSSAAGTPPTNEHGPSYGSDSDRGRSKGRDRDVQAISSERGSNRASSHPADALMSSKTSQSKSSCCRCFCFFSKKSTRGNNDNDANPSKEPIAPVV